MIEIFLQPCNGGAGECVPYYLCVNGTINTDGSDLLDIRFGEGEECVDYFEQCCATGKFFFWFNKILITENLFY